MASPGRDRLERRLARVEARLSAWMKPPEVNAAAVWQRLLRVMGRGDPEAVRRALEDLPTWQALIPTMDPEHVDTFLDVFAHEDWVREQTGRCKLARTVYHLLAGDQDGPLALPKAVAEVCLNDPDTLPIHKCEACGYRIPTYAGPGSEQQEVYFTECPLCGGRIRWELIRMSDSPVGPDGYPLHAPTKHMRDDAASRASAPLLPRTRRSPRWPTSPEEGEAPPANVARDCSRLNLAVRRARMAALPTGTVTFLFADIDGST